MKLSRARALDEKLFFISPKNVGECSLIRIIFAVGLLSDRFAREAKANLHLPLFTRLEFRHRFGLRIFSVAGAIRCQDRALAALWRSVKN
jgi:hypothetical protein